MFKQILKKMLTCLNKCVITEYRNMFKQVNTDKWREESMGTYGDDARQLLHLVGGKENIAAVSHCMTRMRFALVEPGKADVKAIEAMKVVKGSFTQSGQFQVIIGNTVADFYNDFVKEAGIEGVSKDAVKQAAKKNQNPLQRVITALAEIFAPLIPAIITGGLILGFRNCIDSLYLFENGTRTLCDISQFWSGIDSFLWLIGEAVFHMLPVGICWSVTKKMGTTQMLGIVLGLTLVSGQLLNAYAVAGTAAADIPKWNFGGFQVNMIGYQGQVIPAILAAFTLVYLEKFFRKITPQVISMIVVPFLSLLLSVIAAHFVLGPVGWKVGAAVSAVVFAGITGTFKVVFGAVFGVIYAPLVITGLHHMSNAIGVGGIPGILSIQPQFMGSFGICMIIAFAVSFLLTGVVGRKKLAEEVNETAELAEIAAGTGASAAAGVMALVMEEKEDGEKPGHGNEAGKETEGTLRAFLTGKAISLAEVGDGVFSAGILGDGMAIIPENETLYAPADAVVAALMPDSRHACGLKMDNGMEILLHIGLDTVDMKGDGFEYLVEEGQKVSAGTPLIRFNRAKIKAAGHRDVTICVISNVGNAGDFRFHTRMDVKEKETAVVTFR